MSRYDEDFEGGTNGVTCTAANTNFDAVTTNIQFSNAQVMRGSMGCVFDATTGAGRYFRKNVTATSVAIREYIYLQSLSAADERIAACLDSAGSTNFASLVLQGTGRLRLSTTGSTNSWTATNQYSLNTFLRFELYAVAGSTTSNGIAQGGLYLGHDTSPIESFSLTNLNIGGGGGSFGQVRLGKTSGTLATATYFDDMAIDDAATGLLGPSYIPPIPIVWDHTVRQGT